MKDLQRTFQLPSHITWGPQGFEGRVLGGELGRGYPSLCYVHSEVGGCGLVL